MSVNNAYNMAASNGRRLMAINDATRRAVRFWGNDSAMEASFFVTEDSLKRIQPDMRFDEAGLLAAFDLNRLLIYATATKVYGRGHKGSYDLLPDDF
jgi:hypothetical protein